MRRALTTVEIEVKFTGDGGSDRTPKSEMVSAAAASGTLDCSTFQHAAAHRPFLIGVSCLYDNAT